MASLDGLKILLAEDNPTNQMVAMQMLESLGAEVVLAEDGVAAFELVMREPFDVALIDIEMPRLSGTDVIRRVRSVPPPVRDMPLIALTAYVMREHRAAIDEAGADGVIAKPILSIEQLGLDIRAFMDSRRRRRPFAVLPPDVAPAPPLDDEPCVDDRIYGKLAEAIGDVAIGDLLRKMERDIMDVRTRIVEARRASEPLALREATHILVAVAGSIGAVRLQKNSQCLNSAAHSGDTKEMEQLGREVIADIDLLQEFIRGKIRGQ